MERPSPYLSLAANRRNAGIFTTNGGRSIRSESGSQRPESCVCRPCRQQLSWKGPVHICHWPRTGETREYSRRTAVARSDLNLARKGRSLVFVGLADNNFHGKAQSIFVIGREQAKRGNIHDDRRPLEPI